MQALLYCDLVKGTFSETLGGAAFAWPKIVQGDDLTLGLRLSQKIGNEAVEVQRVCRQLRASIGRVDARPEDGTFKLKVGEGAEQAGINATDALAWNVTADALRNAINALAGIAALGTATVELRDGSYLIRFANASQPVSLTLADNALWPVSFGRVRASQFDGQWVHELRFIQAPVASTSMHDRVVPPAPGISRIQDGGFTTGAQWNEVQRLLVPASFRGTYQLRRGYAKSALLSVEDGPEQIAEALKGIADEDGEFVVTNPAPHTAHIEFAGSMKGTAQPLLEVRVFDAPEGDLTFTLPLDTAELSALLRRAKNGEEKLPFEIEAVFEDENDEDILHTVTLLRTEVTMQSELQWEGLTTQANIDWLRPPLPRDYVPFTRDQVITGSQHYVTTLGDGTANAFTVDHNLNTEAVHVTLRHNEEDGPVLVHGLDYALVIHSANSLTVAVSAPVPAPGALAIVVTSAGPVSAFQAHTHTMAQIIGLEALLDGFGADIAELKNLIPTGALLAEKAKEGPIAEWTLPHLFEVYPTRMAVTLGDKEDAGLSDIDLTKLPRAQGLLAAVHDAQVENLPLPVPTPAASHVGRVFANASPNNVLLPGGLGRRSVNLKPGQFAACDGRVWYRVEHISSETSFYPSDFSRELFLFSVNDRQLRLKKALEVQFGIELAVLKSTTKAQWSVVIEWGGFTKDDAPAPTGANLANIVWYPVPLLEQRIVVTPTSCVHVFGARITRQMQTVNGASVDTITAVQMLYGAEAAASSAPATPNFALRGRLIRFDTENSESDPRGFVALLGLNRSLLAEGEDLAVGRAIIKSA